MADLMQFPDTVEEFMESYKEENKMIPWIYADIDTIIDCYSDVEDGDNDG